MPEIQWNRTYNSARELNEEGTLIDQVLYVVRRFPRGRGGIETSTVIAQIDGMIRPHTASSMREISEIIDNMVTLGVLQRSQRNPDRLHISRHYTARVDAKFAPMQQRTIEQENEELRRQIGGIIVNISAKVIELRQLGHTGHLDLAETYRIPEPLAASATQADQQAHKSMLQGKLREGQILLQGLEALKTQLTENQPLSLNINQPVKSGIEDEMAYALYHQDEPIRILTNDEGDLRNFFSLAYRSPITFNDQSFSYLRRIIEDGSYPENTKRLLRERLNAAYNEIRRAWESGDLSWEGDSSVLAGQIPLEQSQGQRYNIEINTEQLTAPFEDKARSLKEGHRLMTKGLDSLYRTTAAILKGLGNNNIQRLPPPWRKFYQRYGLLTKRGYRIAPIWGATSSIKLNDEPGRYEVVIGSAHHNLTFPHINTEAKLRNMRHAIQYFEPFIVACFGSPSYILEGSHRQGIQSNYGVMLRAIVTPDTPRPNERFVHWKRQLSERTGLSRGDVDYDVIRSHAVELDMALRPDSGPSPTELRFPDSMPPDAYLSSMKTIVLISIYSTQLPSQLEDPKNKPYVHDLATEAVLEGYDYYIQESTLRQWMNDAGLTRLMNYPSHNEPVVPDLTGGHTFKEVMEHVMGHLWEQYKETEVYRRAIGSRSASAMAPDFNLNKERQRGLLRSDRIVPDSEDEYTYREQTSKMIYDVLAIALPRQPGLPTTLQVIEAIEGRFNETLPRHRKYNDVLNLLADYGVLEKTVFPETTHRMLNWKLGNDYNAVQNGLSRLRNDGFIVHEQFNNLNPAWHTHVLRTQADATTTLPPSTEPLPWAQAKFTPGLGGAGRWKQIEGQRPLRTRRTATRTTTATPPMPPPVSDREAVQAWTIVEATGDYGIRTISEFVSEGMRGIVNSVSDESDVISVTFPNFTREMPRDMLRVIPPFNVGDHVVMLTTSHRSSWNVERVGQTGVVVRIDSNGGEIGVRWDNDDLDNGHLYYASDFRLAPRQTTRRERVEQIQTQDAEGTSRRFQVGDSVTIVDLDGLPSDISGHEVHGGLYDGVRAGDTGRITRTNRTRNGMFISVEWDRDRSLVGRNIRANRFIHTPTTPTATTATLEPGAVADATTNFTEDNHEIARQGDRILLMARTLIRTPPAWHRTPPAWHAINLRTNHTIIIEENMLRPHARPAEPPGWIREGSHVRLTDRITTAPPNNVTLAEGRQGVVNRLLNPYTANVTFEERNHDDYIPTTMLEPVVLEPGAIARAIGTVNLNRALSDVDLVLVNQPRSGTWLVYPIGGDDYYEVIETRLELARGPPREARRLIEFNVGDRIQTNRSIGGISSGRLGRIMERLTPYAYRVQIDGAPGSHIRLAGHIGRATTEAETTVAPRTTTRRQATAEPRQRPVLPVGRNRPSLMLEVARSIMTARRTNGEQRWRYPDEVLETLQQNNALYELFGRPNQARISNEMSKLTVLKLLAVRRDGRRVHYWWQPNQNTVGMRADYQAMRRRILAALTGGPLKGLKGSKYRYKGRRNNKREQR